MVGTGSWAEVWTEVWTGPLAGPREGLRDSDMVISPAIAEMSLISNHMAMVETEGAAMALSVHPHIEARPVGTRKPFPTIRCEKMHIIEGGSQCHMLPGTASKLGIQLDYAGLLIA